MARVELAVFFRARRIGVACLDVVALVEAFEFSNSHVTWFVRHHPTVRSVTHFLGVNGTVQIYILLSYCDTLQS